MAQRVRHARIAGLLLAVLLLSALPGRAAVLAQPPDDPLLLHIDGDLWSWQGADQPLTQLTSWGLNRAPLLSPDGTRAAYESGAQVFVDWLQTINGAGGFDYPENIWVLDVPTSETYRIADQPADAVYDGPEAPGRYVLRTGLSWSPDGQQVAWFELALDTVTATGDQSIGTGQLVTYDFASGTKHVVVSFPLTEDDAVLDFYGVAWGRPGITLRIGLPQADYPRELRVYDPASGEVLAQTDLDDFTPSWVYSASWLQDGDQDYLFDAQYGKGRMDWQTGEIEALDEAPRLVSPNAPDGAQFYYTGETWMLALPGQSPQDLGSRTVPCGISRDGQWAAYCRDELNPANGYYEDTVIVQSADEQIEVGRYHRPLPQWGPVMWVMP
jgi:hypothetical protein